MYVTTETIDELTAALRSTLGCPLLGRLGTGSQTPG
jgi:hypothetical protein